MAIIDDWVVLMMLHGAPKADWVPGGKRLRDENLAKRFGEQGVLT
jgi:hypothetical protein